jgi:hypothetical protein
LSTLQDNPIEEKSNKLRFIRELRTMITRTALTMAISLSGLLGLVGCQDPKPEDTRHLEHRPPMPPNCPALAELKNVTLKDGTIADVRIVQFRDTKLYFPTRLMKRQFVDRLRDHETGFIAKPALGKYTPDIYSNECAGVVHHIADEKRHVEGIYPMIQIEMVSGDHNIDPQIVSNSLHFRVLNFGLVPKTMSAHAKFILGQNQKIKFNDDVVVQLVVGSTAEPGVKYESQSVLDLTEWLRTPPAYRDNDKQFTLKIDRTIKL